ncbi:hypothetical protein cand_023670 [Cryptosporidium andersoni]|uniref:J domain-containing protein n=1 Tax=Cryptosporidium andersoni TaxID=117008 RepID=A0A1J4MS62_9CRYT|nr:hypothetical protein cand_023670 [Cryptosporidium andersoni]
MNNNIIFSMENNDDFFNSNIVRETLNNSLRSKYILYYVQYINDRISEKLNKDKSWNMILLPKNINKLQLDLEYIKKLLPLDKLCRCQISMDCTCKFMFRYKDNDPNRIYKWVWHDLTEDSGFVKFDGDFIELKVLVLSNYKALSGLVNNNLVFNSNGEYQDELILEYNIQDQKLIDKNKKLDNFITTGLNSLSTSTIYNIDNLFPNSEFDNCNKKHILNSIDLDIQKDEDIIEDYSIEIDKWCKKSDGSYKDIRVLLSSLQQVLWPEAQWEPIEISKLMTDIEILKKAYRKAIIVCHPDRHQKENDNHKHKVHKIFMALNQAYKNIQ